MEAYAPGVAPTRPTPLVLGRDPARERGIFMELGARRATGTIDRDGILEWMEQPGSPPTRYDTIARGGAP